MKKRILVIGLFTIISLHSFSQFGFEEGYFITTNGDRTNCLIKNLEWINNPTEFEYKMNENSKVEVASIENIAEFKVANNKYIRHLVYIDKSSENISALSSKKDPEFVQELLFLKILIEGKANLYIYKSGQLKRFFYSIDNSEIKQFVYKAYLTTNQQIAKNNTFRQQLWNDLTYKNLRIEDVTKLEYRENDLVTHFIKYLKCSTIDFIDYNQGKKKDDLFGINIKPGLNLGSVFIKNRNVEYGDASIDFKPSFKIGAEAEIILPFNKRRWALFIEPMYNSYSGDKEFQFNGLTTATVKIKYNSIDLPVGIRLYAFLNQNSQIFFNIAYVPVIDLNSKVNYAINWTTPELYDCSVKSDKNLNIGVGYKYKKKLCIEIKYGFKREILNTDLNFSAKYQAFLVNLGYSLFK